jgi:hypothetical protein
MIVLAYCQSTPLRNRDLVCRLSYVADPSAPLGTAFTYQGELRTASGSVSGTCGFQFSLWDALANGSQDGVTQTANSVSVSNYFAVWL